MPSRFDFSALALHYDEFYNTDLGKEIDKAEKKAVEELLKLIPPGKTLEIGCGTGYWTEFFASFGNEIIGIDISREMIEVAERKNIPNTVCLVHDVMNLPFKDKFFENIFAIASLEFVSDLNKAFEEIKRLLKDYGYLLVGVLNKESEYFKKKKESPYKEANLFTLEQLEKYLSIFGKPKIKGAIYLKDNVISDNFMTEKEKKDQIKNAAFLCGVVRFENF